jgi:hypothetical protein
VLFHAITVIVILCAAGGAFLAFEHREDASDRGSPSPGPSESGAPVPAFSFEVASVQPLPTGVKKGVAQATHAAATDIHETLDQLYVAGFIDPATWGTGHYHEAWQAFTSDAITTARNDEETLTLGARAGRMFSTVLPHAGSLRLRILIDPSGHPSTAVADVTFAARGTQTNGALAVIRSEGQYFLRPSPRGWSIYAYEVTRDDGPPPAPSPSSSSSGSPSAEASP